MRSGPERRFFLRLLVWAVQVIPIPDFLLLKVDLERIEPHFQQSSWVALSILNSGQQEFPPTHKRPTKPTSPRMLILNHSFVVNLSILTLGAPVIGLITTMMRFETVPEGLTAETEYHNVVKGLPSLPSSRASSTDRVPLQAGVPVTDRLHMVHIRSSR
ncbi:hypothetical protein F5880DRAFT_1609252 [Lentinula raphanica]|nr:hypothetical protein F5880DRAFT_1609252 [Lentinula raphanica]